MVAVLAGLAAGCLRPALGARGVRVRLVRLPLLAAGAVGTAAARVVPSDLAPLAMGLALAVLLAFVLSNAHVTGIVVIGLGLLLNLVAVVLNNGLPVRGEALVAAGVVQRADLAATSVTAPRHLETRHDRLAVLGDVLPIKSAHAVLSFGDLIVIAGAADAVRELARRRRRSWTAGDRVSYTSTMTQLKAVHDWGTAPMAAPVVGSQYSAKPDLTDPVTIDLTSAERTSGARPLVAANQSR
jgi:hypothetical protein